MFYENNLCYFPEREQLLVETMFIKSCLAPLWPPHLKLLSREIAKKFEDTNVDNYFPLCPFFSSVFMVFLTNVDNYFPLLPSHLDVTILEPYN